MLQNCRRTACAAALTILALADDIQPPVVAVDNILRCLVCLGEERVEAAAAVIQFFSVNVIDRDIHDPVANAAVIHTVLIVTDIIKAYYRPILKRHSTGNKILYAFA